MWEYRAVELSCSGEANLVDQLNEFGKEGWEVFQMFICSEPSLIHLAIKTKVLATIYLKRRVEQ